MIAQLALRNLVHRPWRSVLLFAGYGIGVSVMVVLLSIGEALITQASDERLVGGGAITVLPEGLDVEVMKTGGLGGLFFSIGNARFVNLQLLGSPRLARDVRAVSPAIQGKLVYLTAPDGREYPVRASGDIPDAARAVGAAPALAAGRWTSDDGDRAWASPSPTELASAIDHFHDPPAGIARPESWAEWHYFNVLSADRARWAFVSFIVAGDVRGGRWGGQTLVITHDDVHPEGRRYTSESPSGGVRYSTSDADLRIGADSVTVLPDGRYLVRARVRDAARSATLDVDLVVTPSPRAYFPGASLDAGDFASGYAVPGLRADASGTICERVGAGAARCERYDGAQSYHDHNWGTWQGVSWEWGSARVGSFAVLYGRVQPPDSLGTASPLFVYLVDSLGFRAVFRPRSIFYEDGREINVDGKRVMVPSRAVMTDARGADTLRLELEIESAAGTDTRQSRVERGEAGASRGLARPYFIQMKGTARLSGRAQGTPIDGTGTGFFETYR